MYTTNVVAHFFRFDSEHSGSGSGSDSDAVCGVGFLLSYPPARLCTAGH